MLSLFLFLSIQQTTDSDGPSDSLGNGPRDLLGASAAKTIRGSRSAWKIFQTLASSPSLLHLSSLFPLPSFFSIRSCSGSSGRADPSQYFSLHQSLVFVLFLLPPLFPRCRELFPPGLLSFLLPPSGLPSTSLPASTCSSSVLPTRYVTSSLLFAMLRIDAGRLFRDCRNPVPSAPDANTFSFATGPQVRC